MNNKNFEILVKRPLLLKCVKCGNVFTPDKRVMRFPLDDIPCPNNCNIYDVINGNKIIRNTPYTKAVYRGMVTHRVVQRMITKYINNENVTPKDLMSVVNHEEYKEWFESKEYRTLIIRTFKNYAKKSKYYADALGLIAYFTSHCLIFNDENKDNIAYIRKIFKEHWSKNDMDSK